ncbi:hypothetical protein PT974_00287 [Cladobotryum mycophilum]|uniref:SnoaL-like domain-containing protein n=1 Tax=Cladobotryum mycophilum TaxID=491253 RepID=A0ABR0T1M5_9HYPO
MASPVKHTPRSVLDAFYQAEREYMEAPPDKRDFSGMAATLSPNIHMEQTSALPYAGTYVGLDGFQDWSRQIADYFNVVDVQNSEIFEREGSDKIVVLSTVHYRVRKTGEDLYFPHSQTFAIDVEKGQIKEIRPFNWDVYRLNKAIGYVPK